MAVSRGNSVKASEFNNLQSRIAQILGEGSADFGYGQSVQSTQIFGPTSAQAEDADNILAEHINALRNDINTAYVHQNGSVMSAGTYQGAGSAANDFPTANTADIIGADRSAKSVTVDDQNNYSYTDEDLDKGFNDLLDLMSDIESNRFVIHPSQQDVQTRATDERLTNWNGSITSEFTVFFASEDARRFFFNAGGEIRMSGAVDLGSSEGDSLARDQGWKDMIENPGEVQFGHNYTTASGSIVGITFPDGVIGNSQLTSNYQTVFRKDANSGIYGNSYWKVDAKETSTTSISFRITLVDDGPESDSDAGQPGSSSGGVIEPVTANLEFEYSVRRANGTVVVDIPAYQIINTFE